MSMKMNKKFKEKNLNLRNQKTWRRKTQKRSKSCNIQRRNYFNQCLIIRITVNRVISSFFAIRYPDMILPVKLNKKLTLLIRFALLQKVWINPCLLKTRAT